MEKCSDINGSLFNYLSSSEKDAVMARLVKKSLQQGDSLFQIGDSATGIFYVVSGQFAVKKYTGFEDKMQVVALLGAGAVIGEGSITEGHSRTATIVAVEGSEVFELSQKEYAAIKTDFPEIALKMLEHNIKISGLRLEACTTRLAHIL